MKKSLSPVIAALKSGEFSKAQSHLHTQEIIDNYEVDKYCCLGVLCEVNKIPWELSEEGETTTYFGVKGFLSEDEWEGDTEENNWYISQGELPETIEAEFGLDDPIAMYPALVPVATVFGFGEYNYSVPDLQALLIAVNDNTNPDDFRQVIKVMQLIEDHRDEIGYYEVP